MPPINWVGVLTSINNLLNSMLLYYKSVDELKMWGVEMRSETLISLSMIRYLKVLSARLLTTIKNSQLCCWLIEI